jgi:hypothetical protein
MIEHIVALNIFDPDRTPKKAADSGRFAGMPAPNSSPPKTQADPATELERQLEDALKTRTELESLLRLLQQTQGGITKEQTELLRQRIEAYDQQIERIQKELKALRPK